MSNQIPVNDAVRHLMTMNAEVVSAKYIAPILKMSESVIVKYAKDGTWDADRLGNFVISGGHVKFFRKDFLQKCGFLEPEKEEDPTTEMLQMLGKLLEGQTTIMRALRIMIDYQIKEKTADAATPTD